MTVLTLPGGRGTVSVADDGTGIVYDDAGRYRTVLPAHTVAQLLPVAPTPEPAPLPWWARVVARFTRKGA